MTEQLAETRLVADAATLPVGDERLPVMAAVDAPYGVLDVGSNSIRLVVFEGLTRAPAPVFNERELCGLGATLAETGTLAPDAVEPALDALRRFAAAAEALGVGPLDAVTTAAVREASDGETVPQGGEPRDRLLAPRPLGRGGGPLRRARRGFGLPRCERADGGPGRRQP